MKRPGLNLVIPLMLFADTATAQAEGVLGGKVYHQDKNGALVAERNVGVSLDEVGLGEITDDYGVFRLHLLRDFEPGDKVTLSIEKPGWQIFDPPGGRIKIPRSHKEYIQVRLLSVHSREFLAFDRLEKFYSDASEKKKQEDASETRGTRSATGLPRPGPDKRANPRYSSHLLIPPALQPGKTIAFAAGRRDGPVRDPLDGDLSETTQQDAKRERSARRAGTPDFDRYLREWSARYGFSTKEVETEIDRWIAEVEARRENAFQLGLAAFARQQFAEAAHHFRDSARERARRLREATRLKEETAEPEDRLRDELVGDLRLEGDSFQYVGDPLKALASYQEAHSYTSRQETPTLWAATLQDTALAHGSLAGEGPPTARATHLAEAVQAYRQALLVYTHERLPRPWAMTQNNLGVALREQASRTDGERGNTLLAEAVQAYRQALLVYTRDRLPQEWAKTLNNLAIALRAQAVRTKGKLSDQLLGEAIKAYRQALQVRTREQLPEEWARTQSNLGVALQDQATHTDGEPGAQLLDQAVGAYQQALLIRTYEQFPQQWATTQNNLGNALQDQALRTGGEAGAQLFAKAVNAYRQALRVRTYEQFPQDWAMTQNNLGNALLGQASSTDGEAGAQLLAEAVKAFQEALRVHNPKDLPQQWALTQSNLGNALRDQGLRTEGEPGDQLLAEAIRVYRQALRVRTQEQLPQDWAATQIDLGSALAGQAGRAEGEPRTRLFAEALQAYRQAREVFSWEHFPLYWALARRGEAQVLLLTDSHREAAEALSEILTRNPNDSKALYSLTQLLNNRLFDPVRALSFVQSWLARHPEDLTARILEIEALFASGAFAECRQKAASLRTDELATRHGAAVLLGYQLAAGLATDSPEASTDLALLLEGIAKEPPDFRTSWTFPGALHSLQERSDLLYRDWLVRFFKTLEAPNRDSILQQLRALQEELEAQSSLSRRRRASSVAASGHRSRGPIGYVRRPRGLAGYVP